MKLHESSFNLALVRGILVVAWCCTTWTGCGPARHSSAAASHESNSRHALLPPQPPPINLCPEPIASAWKQITGIAELTVEDWAGDVLEFEDKPCGGVFIGGFFLPMFAVAAVIGLGAAESVVGGVVLALLVAVVAVIGLLVAIAVSGFGDPNPSGGCPDPIAPPDLVLSDTLEVFDTSNFSSMLSLLQGFAEDPDGALPVKKLKFVADADSATIVFSKKAGHLERHREMQTVFKNSGRRVVGGTISLYPDNYRIAMDSTDLRGNLGQYDACKLKRILDLLCEAVEAANPGALVICG